MSNGMNLRQCISMLQALEAQGATEVRLARKAPNGLGECASIDWVSMKPVDGVGYIGAVQEAEVLSNEAADALDW